MYACAVQILFLIRAVIKCTCSKEAVLVSCLICVCKSACVGWRVYLTRLLSFNCHSTVMSVFEAPWYGKTFLRRKHRRLSEAHWPLRPSKSALNTRRTHLVRCRSLQQDLRDEKLRIETGTPRCPTGHGVRPFSFRTHSVFCPPQSSFPFL